jgi:membrane-associated phospholipid phosphatase
MSTVAAVDEGHAKAGAGRPPSSPSASTAGRRALLAPPLVAVVTLVTAILVADAAGFAVRDPDNVAAGYLVMVGAAAVLLVGVDVAVRAARATGGRPTRTAMAAVRRDRWTAGRGAGAAVALGSFYVSYMAYRNLKAAVPLLHPALFDRQLADADRVLFAGHDPARLLHALLGSGVSAHILSSLYVAFIVFLPLSLTVALVFARDLPTTLFFATALSANWILGAGSYFLLPSLGPAYAEPALFATLPATEARHLQQVLLDQRIGWLAHPGSGTPQAIAAFASLHIAMSFTAAATAQLLGLPRRLRIGLWAWLAVTLIGTVYLGWHYVVDDIAGLLIGALALVVARLLTGIDPRPGRRAGRPARARVARRGGP